MKNKILILVFLTVHLSSYGQKKKELIQMYDKLNVEHNNLKYEHNNLKNDYNLLIEKHSLSFETPEDYAKSILKLLRDKNKIEASKLLFSMSDSIYFSDKLIKAIKDDGDDLDAYNKTCLDTFDKIYYNGINLGINWQNAIFQKSEFTIDYEEGIDTYVINDYRIFFKSSSKDYSFDIRGVLIINDKPYDWRLRNLVDIEAKKLENQKKEKKELERKKQEEIEFKNKPYVPWGLKIRGANWSYLEQTFSEFRLKIINDTDYYVGRVKFQFSIFTGAEYSGGTKSFSKTYDLSYYVPKGYSMGGSEKLSLEPGDIQEIQIQELRDFFLGEDISNQKNWYTKTTILEVFPKHNDN